MTAKPTAKPTALEKEREFANQRIHLFNNRAKPRWVNCGSSHRFMAFWGKELVLYQELAEGRVTKDIITCTSLSVDLEAGLSSVWENADGELLAIGHTPIEVAESCFIWHTRSSNLEYSAYKGSYNMRFSMVYKTKYNPSERVIGAKYLMERASYESNYGV